MQRAGAAVVGELLLQCLQRVLGLGCDHHARRILVEPVHDAGAPDPADALEARPAMVDERIDQRARPRARGRVHDHADGLVDDDESVVLIEHVERDILAFGLGVFRLGCNEGDCLAGLDAVFGLARHRAVDAHRALKDQVLDTVAAEIGKGPGQGRVEPAAGAFGIDLIDEFDFLTGCFLHECS